MMDRQAASRALAKAIAYADCGKPEQAGDWLASLVLMFEAEGVRVPVSEGRRVHPVQYDLSAASTRLGSHLLD